MPDPADVVPASPATAVCCELAPLAVMCIDGPDAGTFLQGQLSGDVAALEPGRCQYTSYNSPKGRMLANFVLWPDGSGYRALLPAELAEPVAKRLRMFVLRSKVTVADQTSDIARFGVGGPGSAAAVGHVFAAVPPVFGTLEVDGATVLGLPGPRYIVLAPAGMSAVVRERLAHVATEAAFPVWQWLTIRAGVPVVTAATQDQFVAQTANWDVLGGISFRKGCYTGQEIIARMQYLGRLKERTYAFHVDRSAVAAGTRLFSAAFGEQACGTVVNAAPAPDGGSDLLAVVQLAAVDSGDVTLDGPGGPRLAAIALPYAIPAPQAPRARAV